MAVQQLTVLHRELAWYCMRGLRPTSPSTITQARGMAAGCRAQSGGGGGRQAAERDPSDCAMSVENTTCCELQAGGAAPFVLPEPDEEQATVSPVRSCWSCSTNGRLGRVKPSRSLQAALELAVALAPGVAALSHSGSPGIHYTAPARASHRLIVRKG